MVTHQKAVLAVILLLVAGITSTHAEGKVKPRTIGSHNGGAASVHYSPDGKTLASGGGDKTIRVWDLASGKQLHALTGNSGFTCTVRFSPDGKILAAGGYESGLGPCIHLYDPSAGKTLRQLNGHPGGVRRIVFTPDSKKLISGGFDGTVRIWDAATGKEERQLKADSGTIYGLALSADGKRLAATGRDGVKLWDLESGKEIVHRDLKDHGAVALTFSPDGKLLATGDTSKVYLWEVLTGKEVTSFTGFKGEVSMLAFSRDGRTLVTSSYDRCLRRWDVRTGKMLGELEGHTGWVWGLALAPDEKSIASVSVDQNLLVWKTDDLSKPATRKLRLTADQLKKNWDALAGKDAGAAFQAIWTLAADPSNTMPLIRKRLKATGSRGPTAKEVAQMIKKLDDNAYKVREKASADLAKAGPAALPALKRALGSKPSAEVKKRVTRLLRRIDPTLMPSEDLVAMRAVQTLEYIGTTEAKLLLEQLARGPGASRLTEEASQAVARLTHGPALVRP